jgi:hypothetical protein
VLHGRRACLGYFGIRNNQLVKFPNDCTEERRYTDRSWFIWVKKRRGILPAFSNLPTAPFKRQLDK